ncbi:hypothetical protein LCGC14_1181050 [marine sediment metagenome]|uniref:Uncharacterized protein n=1 Tax=marine sediment metagenome TaxID=412755 RepID=A0A0F9P507_9ZZZZ
MKKQSKVKKCKNREESIRELTKQLKEIEDIAEMENLIKDNVIAFKFEEINYRIRKPSPQEKRDINDKRRIKYLELLKDDKYMLKEQWIEVYKKKGVNIREIDEKLIALQNKHEILLLQLATVDSKGAVEDLKNDIIDIKEQQTAISFRKSELLQYSLEDVLDEYLRTYSAYLVLEKEEKKEWIKAFKAYEDFMGQKDDKLFARALYFLNVLFAYEVE